MKEITEIIDQLEVVSYDDCAKKLSASENAMVIVGNVQKLNGSEDSIVVSPLNNHKRILQFKTQDIESIEQIENNLFKVFIKFGSSFMVMSNTRAINTNARTTNRKTFDFRKMKFHTNNNLIMPCDVSCDSCVIGPTCDSCYDCYCDCDSCICDCNYVA